MNRKTILRKACLAAFAFGMAISAFGYGRHVHTHPIDDALAIEFMTKYFGYKPNAGTDTIYDNVEGNLVTTGPTDVAEAEVILIDVNPYWRGVYRYPVVDSVPSYKNINTVRIGNKSYQIHVGATLWQEVKYGVSAVHKVGAPNKTADGKLYSYTGKLGRFYFAKRRKTATAQWGDTSTGSVYRLLGRWYDEWSFLPSNDGDAWGWANFAGLDNYYKLVNGDVWYAPHNCFNSLDKNHIASFIEDGTEEYADGYTATVLFYISDYWDSNDVRGNSKGATKKQPFICLYQAEQNPTTIVDAGDDKEDVQVSFTSTFTNVKDAIGSDKYYVDESNPKEEMWNSTDGGVKEYFEIWRTDKDGNRVKVDEVAADDTRKLTYDSTTHTYTYTDTNNGEHFSSDSETGDDYTYEIVSNLYPVNGAGEKTSTTPITDAKSNNQNAHIPGREAFTLSIAGGTKCTYVPSADYNMGYNDITHVIKIDVVENDITIAAGDVLTLTQQYGNAVNIIKTQDLSSYAGQHIGVVLGSNEWKQITESFQKTGGESQDAYYQLKLTRAPEEGSTTPVEYYSNVLFLNSYKANIAKGPYSHRQGHPSTQSWCPTNEVYHNEVKFNPSTDGNIYQYAVICNGNKTEVVSVTYEEYKGFTDYTVTALHMDKTINPSEAEQTTSECPKMFYTVIAYDKDGNTYGSADEMYIFTGKPQELVYYATPSTEGQAVETIVEFGGEYVYKPKMTLSLNCGYGYQAGDVDTSRIQSVDVIGVYDVANTETPEEVIIKHFDSWQSELEFEYQKEVTVTADKYPALYAELEAAYAGHLDPTNIWNKYALDLWKKEMPKEIFVKITFKEPTAQNTNGLRLAAPQNATVRPGDEYFKYSNWATVPPADGGGPITALDNIKTGADVKVYPNPSSDYFNVVGVDGELCLYNLAGSLVKKAYANGSATINVSDLNKGVYMLKAGEIVKKVIVK